MIVSKSTTVGWVWPGAFRQAQNYLNLLGGDLGLSGDFISTLRNSSEWKVDWILKKQKCFAQCIAHNLQLLTKGCAVPVIVFPCSLLLFIRYFSINWKKFFPLFYLCGFLPTFCFAPWHLIYNLHSNCFIIVLLGPFLCYCYILFLVLRGSTSKGGVRLTQEFRDICCTYFYISYKFFNFKIISPRKFPG